MRSSQTKAYTTQTLSCSAGCRQVRWGREIRGQNRKVSVTLLKQWTRRIIRTANNQIPLQLVLKLRHLQLRPGWVLNTSISSSSEASRGGQQLIWSQRTVCRASSCTLTPCTLASAERDFTWIELFGQPGCTLLAPWRRAFQECVFVSLPQVFTLCCV